MTGIDLHDARPVFIVSTGRAGSKMVARALALHPRLLALHEPQPFLNAEAYARWSGSHDTSHLQAKIAGKRSDLIMQAGANQLCYVESSHFLTHLIPDLQALYGPRPRFVHLYRDGRAFVQSGLRRPAWYPTESLDYGQRIRLLLRRRFLVNMGNEWIDHKLRPPRHLKTRFERIAWLWTEMNNVILRAFETVRAEDKHSMRLEDFGEQQLTSLLSFVGVDAPPKLINVMLEVAATRPNQSGPPQQQVEFWSAHQHVRFEQIAGSMMKRLGYDCVT